MRLGRGIRLLSQAPAIGLAGFAYADGAGAASIEEPRANHTGDPYFTNGKRVVLWVSSTPVNFADIKVVE